MLVKHEALVLRVGCCAEDFTGRRPVFVFFFFFLIRGCLELGLFFLPVNDETERDDRSGAEDEADMIVGAVTCV